MSPIRRTALLTAAAAIALIWGMLRPPIADAQGVPGAPAPFDKGGATIAVVNYLSGSDFLQAYEVGAARQAKALGLRIRLSEAQQDPDRLRSLVQQAIDLHVQGIVINNGTKEAHPGIKTEAVWGVVNSTTPASVADQTEAVFRAHPDITVVFTPWDEFARGVSLGLNELGISSKVHIYGVDTSTSDIQAMREPNSPWVASAATNAAVVGEVSVRALALLIAGQNPGAKVRVTPHLITRDELLRDNVTTIEQLAAKNPAFRESDAALAPWIPVPSS